MNEELESVQQKNKLLETKMLLEQDINKANLKSVELKNASALAGLKRNLIDISIIQEPPLKVTNQINNNLSKTIPSTASNPIDDLSAIASSNTNQKNLIDSVLHQLTANTNTPRSNNNSSCACSQQCCGGRYNKNCRSHQESNNNSASSGRKIAGLLAIIGCLSGLD